MAVFPGILYHGTDERVLSYSEAERKEIGQLCFDVAEYSYGKLVADGFSIYSPQNRKEQYSHILGNRWHEFTTCFQKFDSRMRGSELYNYNHLFLTNSRERAIHFAMNASILGEQGHVASVLFSCVSALFDISGDKDLEISAKLKRFHSLSDLEPLPVLVAFRNVDVDDLLLENGKTIDWVDRLSLYKDNDCQTNFRLAASSRMVMADGAIERLYGERHNETE